MVDIYLIETNLIINVKIKNHEKIISKPTSVNVYVTPKIETSVKKIESATLVLSALLSNEISLYVKARRFDSSVSKENNMELHKLFQFHYLLLEESISVIAERINKLGWQSVDTMREFLKLSYINAESKNYPSSKEMIKELLADHETEIIHLRNDIGEIYEKHNDVDTADFLISRMEAHETMLRLLRRATYPQSHYPMTFYN